MRGLIGTRRETLKTRALSAPRDDEWNIRCESPFWSRAVVPNAAYMQRL